MVASRATPSSKYFKCLMFYLIIETSGEDSFVALCEQDKVLNVFFLPEKEQSRALFPALEKLLTETRLKQGKIEAIGVGQGPGSFTGTRIGVMAAKALGFARKIPLIPFCSLERFVPQALGSFALVSDAHSHGIYLLEGRKEEKGASFRGEVRLVKPDDIAAAVEKMPTLICPHPERIGKKWAKAKQAPSVIPAEVNLSFVAQKVAAKAKRGEAVASQEVRVLYLYAP